MLRESLVGKDQIISKILDEANINVNDPSITYDQVFEAFDKAAQQSYVLKWTVNSYDIMDFVDRKRTSTYGLKKEYKKKRISESPTQHYDLRVGDKVRLQKWILQDLYDYIYNMPHENLMDEWGLSLEEAEDLYEAGRTGAVATITNIDIDGPWQAAYITVDFPEFGEYDSLSSRMFNRVISGPVSK